MTNIELKEKDNIAFIGDLHADSKNNASRIDDIYEVLNMKLNDILNTCIDNNVKHVFFEGDIFNRVSCPHETVNILGELLNKFKDRGIKIYSIVGNHDMYRDSTGLTKSPIETLFKFGLVTHINLNNKVCINDKILITPVDYYEYPPESDKNYELNILLAHMFFNASELISEKEHNLSKDDIKKLGYDYVFLGHDHSEYKPERVGNSVIIRTGSVIRGTSHNYNFARKPKFAIVKNLGNNDDIEITFEFIKHNKFEDIVSEDIKRNKLSNKSDEVIKDMIHNLANQLSDNKYTTDDIIYNIIMNDESLPNKNRNMIVKYINEVSCQ